MSGIKRNGKIENDNLELYNFLDTIIPFMYTTDINDMNNTLRLLNICMESNDYYKDVCKLFNMKSLLDNILGLSNNIYTQKFKESLFNHLIVKKNNLIINKIKSQFITLAYEGKQYIVESIKKYIYDRASVMKRAYNFVKHWNKVKLIQLNQLNNNELSSIIYLESIINFILRNYVCYYMDAYLLGKLFRNSDNISKKIIYVGNFHILLYIDFIKKTFNINQYVHISNHRRCVYLPISELL